MYKQLNMIWVWLKKQKNTHIYIHRTVGEFHQETKIFGSIAGIDPIMAPFFRIQSWRLPTSRTRPVALWLPIVEVTGMICWQKGNENH